MIEVMIFIGVRAPPSFEKTILDSFKELSNLKRSTKDARQT